MVAIDRTRTIFEPRKRYAGVRMQQGRVVLDEDHNEAQELDLEETRRTTRDVVGPSGTPDDGFLVDTPNLTGALVDFTVRAGTMYVGGVPVRLDQDTTFAAQPDWVGITTAERSRNPALPRDLVYLEVWQQPVTAEEDREIAEPALGGPDTTTRVRTMARVRRRSVSASTCSGAFAELTAALSAANIGSYEAQSCELKNDLRLRVSYLPGGVPEDLCSPSVTAGYLGAENQALRIQLIERQGAVGNGELSWGFDNGAPLYRARLIDATTIELESLPKDEAHWPLLGQTVEILSWSAVLVSDGDALTLDGEVLADGGGRAMATPASSALSLGGGHLSTLAASYTSSSQRIKLSTPVPVGFNTRAPAHVAAGIDHDFNGEPRDALVFVRVWNRGSDLTSPARIPYTLGSPVSLGNTGLQATITGTHHGADAHWIVAARPNTPDQVYPWNFEDPAGREANGIRRFIVALGVITWSGTTGTVHDCRKTFRPLTQIKQCCSFTVGDGENSHGDFTSIQAALNNLPDEGGEVCVLPGVYAEPFEIDGKVNVVIHGCGSRSRLELANPPEAMIEIRGSSGITIRDLAIVTETGWGVQIEQEPSVSEVTLERLVINVRDQGGIVAAATSKLVIRDCQIFGLELVSEPEGASTVGRAPLVMVQGSELTITGNRIEAKEPTSPARRVAGGIQVGGESDNVHIVRNRIFGGNGTGITLGHVVTEKHYTFGFLFWVPYWYWQDNCLKLGFWWLGIPGEETTTLWSGGPLEHVWIEDNVIGNMASDGIGVAWFFDNTGDDDEPDDLIVVSNLRVLRNRIEQCNFGEHEAPTSDFLRGWSGHGPIALAAVEDGVFRDNEVRNNGTSKTEPLCGLFVLSGEGLVVEQNRFVNNGQQGAEYVGHLGGIVLAQVGPYLIDNAIWDGRAAVRVAGNQVVAPEGPAVSIRASSGTVEVVDNELTTYAQAQAVSWGLVADIVNNGIASEDFAVGKEFDGSKSPAEGGQIVYSRNVVSWLPPEQSLVFALYLTKLYSKDDISVQGNVCRSDFAAGEGLLFFDLIAFGATLHVSDNRYRERPGSAFFSMFTLGAFNNTTDNTCTHCYVIYDALSSPPLVDPELRNNRSLVHAFTEEWCPKFGFARGIGDASGIQGTRRYSEKAYGYYPSKAV